MWRAQVAMSGASDDNAFFGLKVPEGTDRRELYKSQYRAIYTCARARETCHCALPRCAARASARVASLTTARRRFALLADKMSAAELDQAFREAVTGDGPDGGWSIKNDERVKYVGKLEVAKYAARTPHHPVSAAQALILAPACG